QGYMPNHVGLYNRSQSPYLCRMVKDYIALTGEKDFLAECGEGLRQEYNFWMTARNSPIGLNRYGHHDTQKGCEKFYNECLVERLHLSPDVSAQEKSRVGGHFLANAEATCDFTSRFEGFCLNYCAVDLNALLYEYEQYLKEVSVELKWGDTALWASRAEQRLALMNHYFWDEKQGLFFDYDFVNDKFGPVSALTGFNTLATGVATPEQAARMVANLPLFERDYGIAYAPDHEGCRNFQWDYPNVWPPMVYMTVEGLRRYGFIKEAKRIALKFVSTTIRLFEETGQLWEKTDAETGKVAGGEYDAAPMLGWSAGVFLAMVEFLKSNERKRA
ncbi:MAG: trehalase family glycosidase, partial [Lentisphaeria bacterium]